jgi:hypothetical protein
MFACGDSPSVSYGHNFILLDCGNNKCEKLRVSDTKPSTFLASFFVSPSARNKHGVAPSIQALSSESILQVLCNNAEVNPGLAALSSWLDQ